MVSTGSLQFIHRLVFLGIYYWPKIVQKKIEPRKHSAISIFHLMKLFFFSRFGRCWGNQYQEYEYKETTSRTNKYTNAKWNQEKVQRNEVGFNKVARNLKLNKKKNTRINLERNYKLNYEKSVENYAADNVDEFDDIHDSNKHLLTYTALSMKKKLHKLNISRYKGSYYCRSSSTLSKE